MSVARNFTKQLQAMGIYHLTQDSLVMAEMEAYGKALDQFWEEAEQMKVGCFLDEVENPYGYYFERLFHMEETPYPFVDDSFRQQRIEKIRCMKLRMSVTNTDFNKQAILKQIESYGMTATLVDNITRKTVTVTVTGDTHIMSDYEEKTRRITELIPSHAAVTVKYSAS
ncbi:MAG: hypothetical protein ACOX60_04840 [Massiliimalia sp.]|jgi:hypothetical protein